MFGGNALKTGHGNLDAHWASISHQGDGEAGLFIGDVTAPTGSPGGNLWGGHFQLNAQVAANMTGLRLDFNPTVDQAAKAALGLAVINEVDAHSLTNAIRTAGHWGSHIICYSDAAQTTSIFRVDQSGNVTAVGDVLATRNLLVGNAPDAQSSLGTIAIRDAAAGPAGTPSGGGILFVASGVLKWLDSAGITTTLAPGLLSANVVSGTSYNFAITDASGVVEFTSGSAVIVGVPPNSSVAFPIGTTIELFQDGAGQVTVAPGLGVTIRSAGGKQKLNAQYSSAALRKRGTDEWVLAGDLVA